MHGLDVIYARNLKAAGREAAAAYRDGDHRQANRVCTTFNTEAVAWTVYYGAYDAQRRADSAQYGPYNEGA